MEDLAEARDLVRSENYDALKFYMKISPILRAAYPYCLCARRAENLS